MVRAQSRSPRGASRLWAALALAACVAASTSGCGLTDGSPGGGVGELIVLGDDLGSPGLADARRPDGDAAADAPDAPGPDAGPDANADADADAASPLAVAAEFRALACESFCKNAGATCGFGAIGQSQPACEAACTALAGEDAWWLANYACYSASCNAKACALDGPPLATHPTCDAVCPALDQCELLGALDLPEDQPALCRAVCAGAITANASDDAAYTCILDALGPTCDADALAACATAPPNSLCTIFCARTYDPALDTYCAADTPLRALWPTAASCAAACSAAAPDLASAYRFAGCMDARGCTDLTPCLTLPTTDPPACAAACASMLTLCGSFGGLGDPTVCAPYCAGRFSTYAAGPNPAASACIAASSCPATPDAQGALWFGCLLPDNPDCNTLCARLDACKVSFDPAFDTAACVTGCVTGYFGPPEHIAAIAPCAVAESCAAVLTCFPPPPGTGDPLCQPLCAHLTDDCGAPFDPKCNAACAAAFTSGAEAYAAATCRLVSPCAAQPACAPLDAAPIPAACVDACAASPLTCGGSAARCQGTCAGLLAALPLTAADAPCVITALAFACDPAAPVAACPAEP